MPCPLHLPLIFNFITFYCNIMKLFYVYITLENCLKHITSYSASQLTTHFSLFSQQFDAVWRNLHHSFQTDDARYFLNAR